MKKRNILKNIAKVMAGSLLAVTVFAAISPAMAAFADENEGTTAEAAAGETAETESRRPFPLPLPDGTNSTSITVTMKLSDGTTVSGDTLKAYRIAGVTVDDHGYKLEYIDSFTSLEDKYPLSTYEVEDPDSVLKDGLAGDAAALVGDQTATAGEPQTVKDGKAVFKYAADENYEWDRVFVDYNSAIPVILDMFYREI